MSEKQKQPGKTRMLITAGVFAALILVSTLIKIPVPSMTDGYVNLGDCFVLLSGLLLGPVWGGAASAIGSALSDLINGYPLYAPATFVIKWLMAVAAYALCRIFFKMKFPLPVCGCIAAVAGELVMMGGYLLFELPIYGTAAVVNLIGNSIQGICGAVSAVLIFLIINRNRQLWLLMGGLYHDKKNR